MITSLFIFSAGQMTLCPSTVEIMPSVLQVSRHNKIKGKGQRPQVDNGQEQ